MSDEELRHTIEVYERNDHKRDKTAAALGITSAALGTRITAARARGIMPTKKPTFQVEPLPSFQRPVEEIIESRTKEWERRSAAKDARKIIPIKINSNEPIGILHQGDPHLDDPGTNLPLLLSHIELINKTPGLFGSCVGDYINNWRSSLSHLHAAQSTTQIEALKLLEWYIKSVRWLYLIAGNHDCLDEETEVLTRRGWLKYGELKDNDRVFSLNRETGHGEWGRILAKIYRPNTERMISVEVLGLSMRMTPNHRVLCSARKWDRTWKPLSYMPASQLAARIRIPVSCPSGNGKCSLTDEQIALAGWILTDGSIHRVGNYSGIALYQSKPTDEIERLLNALDIPYKITTRHRQIAEICGRALVNVPLPQNEIRINAAASRRILKWVPEKGKLPDWANDLSDRQFEVLLDAIISGDGSWASNGHRNAAVVHGARPFLDSLQAVAVQHGWRAHISIARGKDHRLNLYRYQFVEFDRHLAVSETEPSAMVWCLTVPHGNFMVRRNGKPHFTGNCWHGDGDPLLWFRKGAGNVYEWHGCRISLQFPNKVECRIHARHSFPGTSIYNPAHGATRAALFSGEDHIYISGHIHTWAYMVQENPIKDIVWHAVQLAAYKKIDDFTDQLGKVAKRYGEACVTIIHPQAKTPMEFVKVFWDVYEGAEFLRWLRKKPNRDRPRGRFPLLPDAGPEAQGVHRLAHGQPGDRRAYSHREYGPCL